MNAAVLPRRKVTRVAVGVLIRADGGVLLADRPVGKPYAGYWEFPGGKIEPGEDAAAALARELHEELGIDIGPSVPWVTFEFDYPHAYVELQFRRVHQWRGEPHSREGQRLRFVDPAGELPRPLLPAAVPALRWLLLPQVALVITPRDVPALADGTEGFDLATADRAARIVVLDADWRLESHSAAIAELRQTEPSATAPAPRLQDQPCRLRQPVRRQRRQSARWPSHPGRFPCSVRCRTGAMCWLRSTRPRRGKLGRRR